MEWSANLTIWIGRSCADRMYLIVEKIRLYVNSVTVKVNKVNYTPQVDGTKEAPNGTNGSYQFTVTVSKGVQIAKLQHQLNSKAKLAGELTSAESNLI